mgnify:FL=1|jgi:hypothetical protein
MSWSLNLTGRAGTLAAAVTQKFIEAQGCPKGSAEETAKNSLGGVAETLVKSMPADKVVSIKAQGSAWNNPDGTANSQHIEFKLSTIGDFIE